MLNNLQWKPQTVLYIFLALCVLSSKHIIIYNEELLVALSALLFVVFVARYFGDTLGDALDSNGSAIRELCTQVSNSKQHYLQQLSKEYSATLKVRGALGALVPLSRNSLKNKSWLKQQLRSHFYEQITLQCATLAEWKGRLQPRLVHLMASNQLDRVLTKQTNRSPSLERQNHKLLSSAIAAMERK